MFKWIFLIKSCCVSSPRPLSPSCLSLNWESWLGKTQENTNSWWSWRQLWESWFSLPSRLSPTLSTLSILKSGFSFASHAGCSVRVYCLVCGTWNYRKFSLVCMTSLICFLSTNMLPGADLCVPLCLQYLALRTDALNERIRLLNEWI